MPIGQPVKSYHVNIWQVTHRGRSRLLPESHLDPLGCRDVCLTVACQAYEGSERTSIYRYLAHASTLTADTIWRSISNLIGALGP
jgi:hypothetical protein